MKTYNNKISIGVFLAVLSVGVFSCQTQLLDPIPKAQIASLNAFDTPARIDLQINALYTFMKAGNFLGGRAQIYGDIRANDFNNRLTNSVTAYQVWQNNLPETSINDVNNFWNAGYAAINQVNVFLKGMSDNATKFVQPTFPVGYEVTANNRVAEARFVRAVCYYTLLQFYARPFADGAGNKPGLPLRLTANTDATGNNLARSTVAEVYTQILDDLNFAELNLPNSYANQGLNTTRAHVNSAIAFKTRVYLTMGNYAQVIVEANKIVTPAAPFTVPAASPGVKFTLNASFVAVFTPPQETLETILGGPFTAQDTPGGQNQLNYFYGPPITGGGNGEFGLNPNGIVANVGWRSTDTRRMISTNGGELFLRKYPTTTPYTDKAPIIRYSEVLLNLAEARFRTIGSADAQGIALLNAVRQRADAGAPALTLDLPTILTERNIEFLGEGLRNTDLLRNLMVIPGKYAIGPVNPTDPNYIWPIPSGELQANTAMVRN